MCGKKNRFIGLAAQPVKQLHHLHFTGEIEKCRRFVQKDHRSLLCQRFGNHHFLSLTITQGMHHAVCQVLNLHQSNGTFDHLLIFSAKCSPKTGIRTASQAYKLVHRHIANITFLSEHYANDG